MGKKDRVDVKDLHTELQEPLNFHKSGSKAANAIGGIYYKTFFNWLRGRRKTIDAESAEKVRQAYARAKEDSQLEQGRQIKVKKSVRRELEPIFNLDDEAEAAKRSEIMSKTRLEVGRHYDFTRWVGGGNKKRRETTRVFVVSEHRRFYLVEVGGHRETVLKNDLITDKYEVKAI